MIRLEIIGKLYESRIDPKEDMPCFRCVFHATAITGCCIQKLCEKELGPNGFFVKTSFDNILHANKDVLHRLKMGLPPVVKVSDDSEFNND